MTMHVVQLRVKYTTNCLVKCESREEHNIVMCMQSFLKDTRLCHTKAQKHNDHLRTCKSLKYVKLSMTNDLCK